MPEREVKLSLDISRLRQVAGLTTEQLPDDASDEKINEVLGGLSVSSGNPEPPAATIPDAPVAPTPQDPNPDGGAAGPGGNQTPKAGGQQVPGGVIMDAEQLRAMNEELAVVRSEREKREQQEDFDYLKGAARAGKIPVGRIEHYQRLMKADRDGTREFVDSLAASIPVHEIGSLGELDDAVKASDYPSDWLAPAERRRVEAARAAYSEGRVGDVDPGTIVREA